MEDCMLRQVVIPSKENSTFSFPSEFYGKEVEVFVVPSLNTKASQNSLTMKELFSKYLYSFDNYKFDREEANDFD
jgi:hypothetical protein